MAVYLAKLLERKKEVIKFNWLFLINKNIKMGVFGAMPVDNSFWKVSYINRLGAGTETLLDHAFFQQKPMLWLHVVAACQDTMHWSSLFQIADRFSHVAAS